MEFETAIGKQTVEVVFDNGDTFLSIVTEEGYSEVILTSEQTTTLANYLKKSERTNKQEALDKLTEYIEHYKERYEERLNEQREMDEYLCGVIDAYESAKKLVGSIEEGQEQ